LASLSLFFRDTVWRREPLRINRIQARFSDLLGVRPLAKTTIGWGIIIVNTPHKII
jgi:hypothetical protein